MDTRAIEELKKCPRCRESKELNLFYKNRSSRDGLNTYCKPCWRVIEKDRKAKMTKEEKSRVVAHNNKWRKENMTPERRCNTGVGVVERKGFVEAARTYLERASWIREI